MEAKEINQFIQDNLITYHSIKLFLKNGNCKIGFFDFFEKTVGLALENKWLFVENQEGVKNIEMINGEDIDLIVINETLELKDKITIDSEYFKKKLLEAMENCND